MRLEGGSGIWPRWFVLEAHIIGIDIFTGKKCEDLCPTSHNMLVSGSGRSGRVAGVVC